MMWLPSFKNLIQNSKREESLRKKPYNIILISIDCARYDAFGFSGDKTASTPNINQIASKGIVFTHAITQAPYTPASHASILTGLNPVKHGIQQMYGSRLREDVSTAQEFLINYGYTTIGVIGANVIGKDYGFHKGFDIFDDQFNKIVSHGIWGYKRKYREVTANARKYINKSHIGYPFFLFLHFFDVHDTPGKEFNKDYARRQLYKIDKAIGTLFNDIKRNGAEHETIWVILSDHGDSFGEHGEATHREYLFDSTLRVPLVISFPDMNEGRKVDSQVRLIDVFPTILDYNELPWKELNKNLDGVSLLSTIYDGKVIEDCLLAYSETAIEEGPEDFSKYKRRLYSIRTSQYKYILDTISKEEFLYDLKADSSETRNILFESKEIAENMKLKLNEILSQKPEKEDRIDGQDLKRIEDMLSNLGYM